MLSDLSNPTMFCVTRDFHYFLNGNNSNTNGIQQVKYTAVHTKKIKKVNCMVRKEAEEKQSEVVNTGTLYILLHLIL